MSDLTKSERLLSNYVNLTPKDNEDLQRWYKRLAKAVSLLPDEEYYHMIEIEGGIVAADWADSAIASIKQKRKLPHPPGRAAPKPKIFNQKAWEKEQPSKMPKGVRPEAGQYDKGQPNKAHVKTRTSAMGSFTVERAQRKKGNASWNYRKFMLQHPEWGKKELEKRAKEIGLKLSQNSIDRIFWHTAQTVEILYDMGYDIPKPKKPKRGRPRTRPPGTRMKREKNSGTS